MLIPKGKTPTGKRFSDGRFPDDVKFPSTGPVSDKGSRPHRRTVKDRKQFPYCPELCKRPKPILETLLTGTSTWSGS
jgi:hypothetical protein